MLAVCCTPAPSRTRESPKAIRNIATAAALLCLLLAAWKDKGKSSEPSPKAASAESPSDPAKKAEVTPSKAPPSGEQTFAEAMTIICTSPSAMGAKLSNTEPSQKAVKLAKWIEARATNEEAEILFDSLASMGPEARTAAVKSAAQKAGLDDCELNRIWEPANADERNNG